MLRHMHVQFERIVSLEASLRSGFQISTKAIHSPSGEAPGADLLPATQALQRELKQRLAKDANAPIVERRRAERLKVGGNG